MLRIMLTLPCCLLLLSSALAEDAAQLDAKTAAERVQAIESLKSGKQPLTKTEVQQLQTMCLQDESPDVRAASCELLGKRQAQPASTIDALIAASLDAHDCADGRVVGRVASQSLAEFQGKAIPRIRELLQGDDQEKVKAALYALDSLGPYAAEVSPDLLPHLKNTDNDQISGAAINAVTKIGTPAKAAVPELIKYLSHENFHLRYWSCRALASIGPDAKEATPHLIKLVKEGRVSVRRHAAMALGKIGVVEGQDVVGTLVQALDDPLQPVKIAAVTSLGELAPHSKSALPVLKQKLTKRSFNVRAHAAMTLWRLEPGSEQARTMLVEELNNELSPYEAVEVIGIVGAEMKLAPDVAKALDSTHSIVRESAALALVSLGDAAHPYRKKLALMLEEEKDRETREVLEAVIKLLDEGAAK